APPAGRWRAHGTHREGGNDSGACRRLRAGAAGLPPGRTGTLV
ncbi:MAG: hypothetical protein AVDCRST_MAG77-1468, partial [uncultured Chloroflexi bacterium]